jgi:bifunctional enzyme CysN/CysC
MASTTLTTPKHGELLRFATAGSVDDGKSTLIGRLLYDTKSIFEDQLEQVAEASKRRHGHNGAVDLSMLTDGLRAEREQGITIDVAYRYFATPRRTFIIADTPGHELYTRNMVTGASTADLALVLVDARNGVVRQSRRHTFVSSLLRIPHIVVAINKMDLVDWSEDRYEEIVAEFTDFAAKLELSDVTFIPVSALLGDNVVDKSPNMPWYDGTPLLRHLEHVHIASDRNLIDPRFPVQWVVRPGDSESAELHDYRSYAGQVASGVWRKGDDVVVLPSGAKSRVAGIDTFDGEVDEAYPPMSVSIRLEDDIDISRGDMLARSNNRPDAGREIDAVVCWMNEAPATERKRYIIKHTTRSTRAILSEVVHRIDVDTLHHDNAVDTLDLNEIGRVRFRTAEPLLYDPYRRNRVTGSFIVIDEGTNETVGAGMIIRRENEGRDAGPGTAVSENVVRQPSKIDRAKRWDALSTHGATVWLTGLPSSGKSTVADELESRLVDAGVNAYRLDGDNLRHGINGNLGFSAEDRAENVRRTAHVARLLADSGTIAIGSLVSPYAADRAAAREIHEAIGLDFVEVFVDTPLEECERRDTKGLYAKARAGEISGMTGIDDPYEAPTSPDVILKPDTPDPVETVLSVLRARGILPPA